nr:phage holin family protein [Amycolatopsis arida]
MSSPKHQLNDNDGVGSVPYLPLSEATASSDGDQSIGTLVRDATQHLSTLVRAEVELAKSELVGEVKKGLKGTVFLTVALVIALYSSFFFFFFLGELLSEWLWRWAAFGIVFLLMLAVAALFGLLAWRKIRKVRAPERTISSVRETAAALKPRRPAEETLPEPRAGTYPAPGTPHR